jgi:DNA-binding protein YbaB
LSRDPVSRDRVTTDILADGGTVTEPGLTPQQRVTQVAALQRQADDAMAALTDRVAAAKKVREQALAVSGEASSRDGTIRVVVDSTGVVTSLTLAPSVFERGTPERLGVAIVATVQEAAAKARAAMTAAMEPIRADGAAARAATAAVPGLEELRFGVPEVPRTAVDPTGEQDPWRPEPEPAPRRRDDDSNDQADWLEGPR